MVNDTYGLGHTFENYPDEDTLKTYLHRGEATLGQYGGKDSTGIVEWGHFFIVFHAKNGKLYAIDSQDHSVTILSTYLSNATWNYFLVLTEPSKSKSKHKFIIPEIVKKSLDKDTELYRLQLLSLYPTLSTVGSHPIAVSSTVVPTVAPSGMQSIDDMFTYPSKFEKIPTD
jgi:hypothetical protein